MRSKRILGGKSFTEAKEEALEEILVVVRDGDSWKAGFMFPESHCMAACWRVEKLE